MTDLEIIFEYFKSIYNDKYLSKDKLDYTNKKFHDARGNERSVEHKLFSFVTDYFGYNAFPCVIRKEEYNLARGKEQFHGFRKFSHGADMLSSYQMHYCLGYYCDGFFLTDNKAIAEDYTKINLIGPIGYKSKGKVLPIKLAPSTKVLDIKQLRSMLYDLKTYPEKGLSSQSAYGSWDYSKTRDILKFWDTHKNDALAKEFYHHFLSSKSAVAIFLGADAIEINDLFKRFTCVLNRGKILVSDTDSEYFIGKTNKDLTLNYCSIYTHPLNKDIK